MILNTIQELCTNSHTNISELERNLKFGNGTVRKWNNSYPSVDKVKMVADYFDISVDYLIGNNIQPFSIDAISIAKTYDELPSDKKQAVKMMLKSLSQ